MKLGVWFQQGPLSTKCNTQYRENHPNYLYKQNRSIPLCLDRNSCVNNPLRKAFHQDSHWWVLYIQVAQQVCREQRLYQVYQHSLSTIEFLSDLVGELVRNLLFFVTHRTLELLHFLRPIHCPLIEVFNNFNRPWLIYSN